MTTYKKHPSHEILSQSAGTITIACGGIITRMGPEGREILLTHSAEDDTWRAPGGSLQEGETLRQCAVREILEETGLRATLEDRDPVVLHIIRGMDVILLFDYWAEGDTEQPLAPEREDITAARYFPLSSLPENCTPNIVALQRFL